jgi:drug/metabolite transporter (DMT)-like permease
LRMAKGDMPACAMLGLFGIVGYHSLFFASLNYTSVGNTAVINAFNPAVTAVLAALFIRERLSWVNYGGVIIALAGVILVVTHGQVGSLIEGSINLGDLLMLAAVVSWAIYALVVKKLSRTYNSLALTFHAALFGLPMLVILSLIEHPFGRIMAMSSTVYWAVLYMGVVASGIGYLLYNLSIREIGPTKTSSMVYSIVPVTVAVLAALFFGEPITMIITASIVLVIVGLNFVLRQKADPTGVVRQ